MIFCIFKTMKLKFLFIELINTKKPNAVIGAIYKHNNMDLDELNDIYFNPLLYKISSEIT